MVRRPPAVALMPVCVPLAVALVLFEPVPVCAPPVVLVAVEPVAPPVVFDVVAPVWPPFPVEPVVLAPFAGVSVLFPVPVLLRFASVPVPLLGHAAPPATIGPPRATSVRSEERR